ncbi:TrkH family potassium uptake protein [Halovulum sp. GXIMD14793]
MARLFLSLPLPIALMLLFAVLMFIPAAHALRISDFASARTFWYHGLFFIIISVIFGLALANRKRRSGGSRQLASLLLCYLILPVMMAMPVAHLVPWITFSQAYFEMLSCLTTTGSTLFSTPEALPDPIHTWRAVVGWGGGLFILSAAVAILEPLKLGGFEIQASLGTGGKQRGLGSGGDADHHALLRAGRIIAVPYAALTLALMVALVSAGDRAFVAMIHAMSVMSTSGITPLSEPYMAASGRIGEILIFGFLFFAVSRRPLVSSLKAGFVTRRGLDPEFKIALACVVVVPAILFARHFVAALEVSQEQNITTALRALWGGMFNVLSFLTTMGFESGDWDAARNWTGLGAPGLILLTLCVMGGGIATTAGGVKLLRVYALYKHGRREMGRLIYPHSVGGAGMTARQFRREGARIAWIFLMMFLFSIAFVLLALTALDIRFDAAFALAVATLTNTGPAADLLGETGALLNIDGATQAVLCAAMILGRLETLVVIALFNPGYWRK